MRKSKFIGVCAILLTVVLTSCGGNKGISRKEKKAINKRKTQIEKCMESEFGSIKQIDAENIKGDKELHGGGDANSQINYYYTIDNNSSIAVNESKLFEILSKQSVFDNEKTIAWLFENTAVGKQYSKTLACVENLSKFLNYGIVARDDCSPEFFEWCKWFYIDSKGIHEKSYYENWFIENGSKGSREDYENFMNLVNDFPLSYFFSDRSDRIQSLKYILETYGYLQNISEKFKDEIFLTKFKNDIREDYFRRQYFRDDFKFDSLSDEEKKDYVIYWGALYANEIYRKYYRNLFFFDYLNKKYDYFAENYSKDPAALRFYNVENPPLLFEKANTEEAQKLRIGEFAKWEEISEDDYYNKESKYKLYHNACDSLGSKFEEAYPFGEYRKQWEEKLQKMIDESYPEVRRDLLKQIIQTDCIQIRLNFSYGSKIVGANGFSTGEIRQFVNIYTSETEYKTIQIPLGRIMVEKNQGLMFVPQESFDNSIIWF